MGIFKRIQKAMDRNRHEAAMELSNAMNGHNRRARAPDEDASVPNAPLADPVSRSSDEITWEMVWSEPMERVEMSLKISKIVPWAQYDVAENIKNQYLLFTGTNMVHMPIAHQMRSLRSTLESIGISLSDLAKTDDGAPDIVRLLASDAPSFRVRFADPAMVGSYLRALQKTIGDPTQMGTFRN